MANPILETKLTIPRARRALVTRTRLVDQLIDGSDVTLTLVSAPAGSGKTTLLTEWAASEAVGSIAWLSLDLEDNRYDSFWAYVIAAFQRVAPQVGAGALSLLERSPASQPALTVLLNDLKSLQSGVSLVLDDYHVIGSVDIHESLAHFLDHLPENVNVVIASRSDPALPLARLRARGELLEIRISDLQFTPAETDTYLTQLMGLSLSPPQLEALEQRTEGWAAALQLAALSMQDLEDVSAFVSDFAGTERYVVDYLVEEVLDRQPNDVRDFLLHTSILSRLTGPLCDAVTERSGGAAMLEKVERDNLLIVPLDARRQWYRYHHLFADVLQERLRAEHPELLAPLHRRASDWYESAGNPSEAIKHALAAEDYGHAADLVEWAIPALRRDRDEATMRTWFEALPPELFASRPVLSVGYVGALLACGELDGVEELLQSAEHWIGGDRDQTEDDVVVANTAELRRLPSAVALYRSAQALMTGKDQHAIAYAGQAFELAGADDHLERGGAAGLLALTHWSRGDLDDAYDNWAIARDNLELAGHSSDVAGCSISMADIRSTQGRLGDALQIYQRGLRIATEGGSSRRGTADMHVGIGEILRERNDLAGARDHLKLAKELGDRNGLPQNLYRSRLLEARLREAEGNLEGAVDPLAEAKQVYFTDFSPDVRPVSAVEARLLVRAGRLSDARRWADASGLSLSDEPTYLREFGHVTLARVLIAEGASLAEVDHFLERLLTSAEEGGRTANVIEILIVLALTRHAADDTETAVASLAYALVLAEPEGFTRIFLDEGDRITPLLRLVAAQANAPAHAANILAKLVGPRRDVGAQRLVDPLTDREREVLQLLSTDMTGPDIARELYISLNTMRTHTKSIYTKLGVGNRRAAMRRAAELDLL